MPRVSKVDSCMICGDTPCSCGRKRVAKPNSQSHAPMKKPEKLEIPRLRPRHKLHQEVDSTLRTQVSEDDLVLIAALRNVEPIMSDQAREQFQNLLMAEETPEERKAFWKARRNETQA